MKSILIIILKLFLKWFFSFLYRICNSLFIECYLCLCFLFVVKNENLNYDFLNYNDSYSINSINDNGNNGNNDNDGNGNDKDHSHTHSKELYSKEDNQLDELDEGDIDFLNYLDKALVENEYESNITRDSNSSPDTSSKDFDYYYNMIFGNKKNHNEDNKTYDWQERAKHYKYDSNDLDEGDTYLWPPNLNLNSLEKRVIKNEYEDPLKVHTITAPETFSRYYMRTNIRDKDVMYSEKYFSFFNSYNFPSKWIFHVRLSCFYSTDRIHKYFYDLYGKKSLNHYKRIGITKHSYKWFKNSSVNWNYCFFYEILNSLMYNVLYYSYELDSLEAFYYHLIKKRFYSIELYSKLVDIFNILIICLIYYIHFFVLFNRLNKVKKTLYSLYQLKRCIFFLNLLEKHFNLYIIQMNSNLRLLIMYIFFFEKEI